MDYKIEHIMGTSLTKEKKDVIEYFEMLGMLKHYSTLRFAILTLFFAITSALMTAYFKVQLMHLHPGLSYLLIGAGILTALFFFNYEIQLSMNYQKCVDISSNLEKDTGFKYWNKKKTPFWGWTTSPCIVLHVFVFAFWIVILNMKIA